MCLVIYLAQEGSTALMAASLYGHTGIALILLQHGAIVDQRDEVMIMNTHLTDHSTWSHCVFAGWDNSSYGIKWCWAHRYCPSSSTTRS